MRPHSKSSFEYSKIAGNISKDLLCPDFFPCPQDYSQEFLSDMSMFSLFGQFHLSAISARLLRSVHKTCDFLTLFPTSCFCTTVAVVLVWFRDTVIKCRDQQKLIVCNIFSKLLTFFSRFFCFTTFALRSSFKSNKPLFTDCEY